MEDIRKSSINISKEIQEYLEYSEFVHELQRVVGSDKINIDNFESDLSTELQKDVLDTRIRNLVFHWLREGNEGGREGLDYMIKAQDEWEIRIWKSLIEMAKELKSPLGRGRLNSEQEMIQENWSEISQWDLDLSRFKPIYSPKDFLECILDINNPNYNIKQSEKLWSSFPGIPIRVPSLQQLKLKFGTLNSEPHSGLIKLLENEGDGYGYNGSNLKTILNQRSKLCEYIQGKGLSALAEEYLKGGTLSSQRGKIWEIILSSKITQEHRNYYDELKEAVVKSDLLIDRITLKDVELTAGNDDEYFVFEDSLYQTLLCFTRDTTLLNLFKSSSKNPLRVNVKPKNNLQKRDEKITVVYPPNGILPFHGFTMYLAPLCFVFDDPLSLYYNFRSFYTRYWFRLHEINSHENGIISLCILFEKLLQRHETELWLHLKATHSYPIRIVFKWLIRGFSGYLPAEEVLILWDLLLAYNSPQIFPLFSIGILSLRKSNLMKAQSPQTIDSILADLSSISVLPVLQIALGKQT